MCHKPHSSPCHAYDLLTSSTFYHFHFRPLVNWEYELKDNPCFVQSITEHLSFYHQITNKTQTERRLKSHTKIRQRL